MIQDLLNKKNINSEFYNLSSDFAEVVVADNANNLLSVKLLQRLSGGKFDYDDVLYIGFQKPQVGTKGVVVFVGKQKYPVFIPLLLNTSQKSGTVKIQVSNFDNSNLKTDVSKFEQMDDTFPYFNFNGGSPPHQRYVMPEVHIYLKLIAQDWYFSPLNPTQKKLYMGDGALKDGSKFHKSHHTGLDVDIYVDGSASNIENVYSFEQIVELLKIMQKNGVLYVFFDPADKEKYNRVMPNFVREVSGGRDHKDHFHLNFN